MTPPDDRFLRPRHLVRLWLGVFAPPAAWALQLGLSYALVPHLCRGQHGTTALQAVSVAAAALAVAGLALCALEWRASGRGPAGYGGTPADRTRFVALAGLALGTLLLAAIVAQTVPVFWIGPCE